MEFKSNSAPCQTSPSRHGSGPNIAHPLQRHSIPNGSVQYTTISTNRHTLQFQRLTLHDDAFLSLFRRRTQLNFALAFAFPPPDIARRHNTALFYRFSIAGLTVQYSAFTMLNTALVCISAARHSCALQVLAFPVLDPAAPSFAAPLPSSTMQCSALPVLDAAALFYRLSDARSC